MKNFDGAILFLLMLIFGLLGYYRHNRGYPPVATVVGLILSPIAEKNVITALAISRGSLAIFFQFSIAHHHDPLGANHSFHCLPLLMKRSQAAKAVGEKIYPPPR
jgi:TctA family transporter